MSALAVHYHNYPKLECRGGGSCIGFCTNTSSHVVDGVTRTLTCASPAIKDGLCRHCYNYNRNRKTRLECPERHEWDDETGDCKRCPLNIKS